MKRDRGGQHLATVMAYDAQHCNKNTTRAMNGLQMLHHIKAESLRDSESDEDGAFSSRTPNRLIG